MRLCEFRGSNEELPIVFVVVRFQKLPYNSLDYKTLPDSLVIGHPTAQIGLVHPSDIFLWGSKNWLPIHLSQVDSRTMMIGQPKLEPTLPPIAFFRSSKNWLPIHRTMVIGQPKLGATLPPIALAGTNWVAGGREAVAGGREAAQHTVCISNIKDWELRLLGSGLRWLYVKETPNQNKTKFWSPNAEVWGCLHLQVRSTTLGAADACEWKTNSNVWSPYEQMLAQVQTTIS